MKRWRLEFSFLHSNGKWYTERPLKRYWFRRSAERARDEYLLMAYLSPSPTFLDTKIEVVRA